MDAWLWLLGCGWAGDANLMRSTWTEAQPLILNIISATPRQPYLLEVPSTFAVANVALYKFNEQHR